MLSHNASSLPRISRMRSPRRTPCARRKLATCAERSAISRNERFCSLPSSLTIHSAGWSLSRASTLKWSSAQLKVSSFGHWKSREAPTWSSRCARRKSRAERKAPPAPVFVDASIFGLQVKARSAVHVHDRAPAQAAFEQVDGLRDHVGQRDLRRHAVEQIGSHMLGEQ